MRWQPRSWCIERRDSNVRIPGRSWAIFLRHQLPRFAKIHVYADGLIQYGDGPNGYDFDSFVRAVERGSISTSLKPNDSLLFEERLSGLGSCAVEDFRSLATDDDLIRQVRATIDELNPGATGLLDFKGVDYEAIDPENPGIRRLRTAYAAPAVFVGRDAVGRDAAGRAVIGHPYRVVVRDHGEWLLTDWMIQAGGMSRIGASGASVSFHDVVASVRAGQVTSSVPDGQWINMDGLGLLRPGNATWWVSPEGLIAEAEDILARLQGKEGVVAFCLRALRFHMANPSPDSLGLLGEAHDLIPIHMREPCLGRDENPVRSLLGLPPVNHTDNDYTPART